MVAIACPHFLFLIISKFPNNTREINNYKQPNNLSFWFTHESYEGRPQNNSGFMGQFMAAHITLLLQL